MALSQAAAMAERAIGHIGKATTTQDVANPAIDRSKYADPSGETMKALVWNGKNSVRVGELRLKFPRQQCMAAGTDKL